jgi:hypothetical protein
LLPLHRVIYPMEAAARTIICVVKLMFRPQGNDWEVREETACARFTLFGRAPHHR